MMDVVIASGYGSDPRHDIEEEFLGGFDSKDAGGYVTFAGLQMSMTSSDVFDYSNMALFETKTIRQNDSSPYQITYGMKDLHSTINPNLDCRIPVILGIRPIFGGGDHTILVDGYGIASSDIGLHEMYHHIVMGSVGGNLDMYYPMDNFKTEFSGGPAYFTNHFLPVSMLYNITSEDLGSGPNKRREIVSGRLSFAGKPYPNATVSAETTRGTFAAKTAGVLVEAPASTDATVFAQLSHATLGATDEVTTRGWTASLLTPTGAVYATRATSGDVLSFPVASADNAGGEWLEGDDVYVWNPGDGHDTVDFYYFTRKDGDGIGRLRLGVGILSGDVSVAKLGLSDVRIVLPGGGA